jgi:hypothetical protein
VSVAGACADELSSVAGASVAVGFCTGFTDGVEFLLPQAMRIRDSADISNKRKEIFLKDFMFSSVSGDKAVFVF